jgi:hypothetical protein
VRTPTATPDPTPAARTPPDLRRGANSRSDRGDDHPQLKYWERHQLDYHRDAVAVEYSVNGGAFTDVPAPSDSPASGCDAADDTSGWEALSCIQDPTVNFCGYPDTKIAFSGPLEGGTSCGDFATSGSVTPYAHRCHQITGLTPNDTIQFRWRSSTDLVSGFAGFYIDDVAVTDVKVPNACAPNTCVGQANGTACSDGNTCTSGDVCNSGLCTSGSSAAPSETQSVSAAADKTTYNWAADPAATRYDAVRGLLSGLPVGPGGGDESVLRTSPARRWSTPPFRRPARAIGTSPGVRTTVASDRLAHKPTGRSEPRRAVPAPPLIRRQSPALSCVEPRWKNLTTSASTCAVTSWATPGYRTN